MFAPSRTQRAEMERYQIIQCCVVFGSQAKDAAAWPAHTKNILQYTYTANCCGYYPAKHYGTAAIKQRIKA